MLGFPLLDAENRTRFSCFCAEVVLTKRTKGIDKPNFREPRYLDYNLYSFLAACGGTAWGFTDCAGPGECAICCPECAPVCSICALGTCCCPTPCVMKIKVRHRLSGQRVPPALTRIARNDQPSLR